MSDMRAWGACLGVREAHGDIPASGLLKLQSCHDLAGRSNGGIAGTLSNGRREGGGVMGKKAGSGARVDFLECCLTLLLGFHLLPWPQPPPPHHPAPGASWPEEGALAGLSVSTCQVRDSSPKLPPPHVCPGLGLKFLL